MNRVELKQMAKQQIKGKIGTLFVITLVMALLSGIGSALLSLIPVVGSIAASVFISAPLALGMVMVYLKVSAGMDISVSDLFDGYGDFWNAFATQFMVGLFTFLWSLLFVVPGIIKSFSYSMSMYILAENKGMGPMEAIRISKEMMNGHKMDYFVLMLSFIGWGLLVGITFGIAGIWVVPYMQTTMTNFYCTVKSSYQASSYAE